MHRKHIFLFSLIVCFVISLYSCKKVTKSSDIQEDVICPLSYGNYWTYQDSVWNSDTGEFIYVSENKIGITGTTTVTIDGSEYLGYHWNYYDTDTSIPFDYKFICINSEDGLWYLGGQSSNTLFISKSLWIKYPVDVGDSWPFEIIYYDGTNDNFFIMETVIVQCIAKNEKFITDLGEFECIVYHYYSNRHGGRDTYLYYLPNIGMVGSLHKKGDIIYRKRKLTSYNLE